MRYLVLFSVLFVTFFFACKEKAQNPPLDKQMVNISFNGTKKDSLLYKKMGKPQPGEWLYSFDEPGQSVTEFVQSKPNIPTDIRKTIYLTPIERNMGLSKKELEQLRYFVSIYFGLETKMQSSGTIDTTKFDFRMNDHKQYKVGTILDILKGRLPNDAYCQIAVTRTDLYPDENWNYVFGMAYLYDRVGVFSFARYSAEDKKKFLWRCMKIVTHETGHMFGMAHCTSFQCNMNGSNSLEEMEGQPMHLCPQCLSKLARSVKLSTVERYQKLHAFYKEVGLLKEQQWTALWLELHEQI